MVGSITARTPDFFGWLVAASVGALLSAVVTAICVKYEDRWLAWVWAAAFFILLYLCTGRCVLLGEVAVKSRISICAGPHGPHWRR
jgi:hypothetical protein